MRKSFHPSFKAASADGSVAFVVATLNVIDSDGDVTVPGFFGKQDVQVLPAHDRFHVPLGKGQVYEDGEEAIAEVKFNLDIPDARDWHSAIKFDLEHPPSLQEYSYGFRVLPGGAKSGEFGGRRVQYLQPKADGTPGADVYEVSPVIKGAGVNTRTLEAKGLKQPNSEVSTALRNAGRERYGSDVHRVWDEEFDLDELWVIFTIYADDEPDRLVRVSFTRHDDGTVTLGNDERDVQRTVGYAPKGADRLAEHTKSVLADLGALHTRASEVVALRAEKGKRISAESLEDLRRIVEEAKGFEELLVGEPATDTTSRDEAARQLARFVAIQNGAPR